MSSIIFAVFSNALYRYYDQERRAGRLDVFVSTLAVGSTASLVVVGAAGLLGGKWVGLQGAGALAWAVVLTWISTFQDFVSQVNRMEHRVIAFAVGKLFDPVWQLGAPLVFFAVGITGFPALAGTAAVAGAGSLLVAGVWAWPVVRAMSLRKMDRQMLTAAVAYGLPLIPLALVGWVITSSSRFVVQHFLGSEATGVFSMGYGLASMPVGLLSSVLVMMVGPVVWERFNIAGRTQALALVRRIAALYLALALPTALGLGVLADLFVRVFFSASYSDALVVILPVAFGSVLGGLYTFLVKPWELHEATRWVPVYVGAGAVMNLAVTVWLVPRIGIAGAAWACLIAYAVVAGLLLVDGRRRYGVWLLPGWRDSVTATVACAIMTLVLMVLRLIIPWRGAWGLVALVCAGAASYLASFVALGWALKSELLVGLSSVGIQPLRRGLAQPVPKVTRRIV